MVKLRQRKWLPTIHRASLTDFGGGLNLRDALWTLAENESPDCINVTFDEQGGVVKRLGYRRTLWRTTTDLASLSGTPSVLKGFMWSSSVSSDPVLVAQVGRTVYIGTTLGWTTHTNLWSTTAAADYAIFAGKLCAVHPADGVKTLDSHVAVSWNTIASSPKGRMCAVWDTKLWVGDGGATTNWARLTWSGIGDPTSWPAANYVDVFDLNGDSLTALAATEAALVVFKSASTYRVYDSTTGANQVIDANVGCVGPHQVAQRENTVFVLSYDGIFATNGAGESKELSGKISNLFDPAISVNVAGGSRSYNHQLNNLTSAAMGWNQEKLVVSVDSGNAGANDLTLELHTRKGWIAAHDFGAAAFANIGPVASAASPAPFPLMGVAAGGVNVMDFFVGSKDNANRDDSGGSSIACWWRSRPFSLSPGHKVRLRQIVPEGRGSWTLGVWSDPYALVGTSRAVTCPSSAHSSMPVEPLYSLGCAREFTFTFTDAAAGGATTDVFPYMALTAEAGGVAMHALHLDYIPLGVR